MRRVRAERDGGYAEYVTVAADVRSAPQTPGPIIEAALQGSETPSLMHYKDAPT
jgi:hypothetical protein